MKLLYGTNNPAKIQYMRNMLSGLDLEIIGLNKVDISINDIDESGNSPLENAKIKAIAYFKATKMPVFSCDSGLYIDGLPDEEQPGVHVRRINDKALNDEEMIDYYSSIANRFGGKVKARYKNAICLVLGEDNIIEYEGDDIASEPFLLTAKAHPTRINGFPLDSLSVDIRTGQYYLDIQENNKNENESTMTNGFRNFFLGTILKERLLEPRYKIFSDETIQSYKDEQVSVQEIEFYLGRKLRLLKDPKKLTGGRVSSVYKINHDNEDKVIKFSTGKYRIIELEREAKILKYLVNEGYGQIVPKVSNFIFEGNFAYLIEDYLDGESVREKLSINEDIDERLNIWGKVGQVLSDIHKVYVSEDINNSWLTGQLEVSRINMENNLLDADEFQEESPESMLEWLKVNMPKRNQICLIHGDYRTKNIMIDTQNNCKVIDWGFVDLGDPYYDLAIVDYYFKDNLDRDSFYRGYKDRLYDETLIGYYEKLSKFINV